MKSVLISIQPYWVFLIIAEKMGWNVKQEKTIEVRKSHPKDENWDKVTKIYCSKDKKSFAKIPKEYQPLMEKFLGKVIGEFVCECITSLKADNIVQAYYNNTIATCLTDKEIMGYANNGKLYYWHISNLVIYDKPKELYEFQRPCDNDCDNCKYLDIGEVGAYEHTAIVKTCLNFITRPPQSWCYVESGDT